MLGMGVCDTDVAAFFIPAASYRRGKLRNIALLYTYKYLIQKQCLLVRQPRTLVFCSIRPALPVLLYIARLAHQRQNLVLPK